MYVDDKTYYIKHVHVQASFKNKNHSKQQQSLIAIYMYIIQANIWYNLLSIMQKHRQKHK